MSSTFGLIPSKEYDGNQMIVQNKTLLAELQQCQADKEFVWSLWKRLQISNPDVTEAISLAIQREKEKAEFKDRKVLEILQNKDDRIEEILEKLGKQSRELKDNLAKRVDLQEDNGRLEAERNCLQDKVSTLEIQLRAFESREKSFDEIHKKTLEAIEREKQELKRRNEELSNELDKVRDEKSDHLSTRIQVEANARSYEREVLEKNEKIEKLLQNLEECERIIQQYEVDLKSVKDDLHYKNIDLQLLKKEVNELKINNEELTEYSHQQTEHNKQLENLQYDTKNLIKNQDAVHSIETQQMYNDIEEKCEKLKKNEIELKQQVLILKKERLDKETIINELHEKIDRNIKHQEFGANFNDGFKDGEPVLDYEYKIECMKNEIDILRQKLQNQDRNNSLDQSIEWDVEKLNRGERTHSTPSRDYCNVATSPIHLLRDRDNRPRSKPRTRSCSPVRSSSNQHLNLQKKLDDTHHLLHLKNKELSEVRKVHNKRLERYKTLHSNYKIIKDQINTVEDRQYLNSKKKKLRRSDPKSLTKEDSDGVWNELAYFKRENRNLVVDRMTIQEELDTLRVQASHDVAAIHELQIAIEEEREEHVYEMKKYQFDNKDRTEFESQLKTLKSELKTKEILIQKLEKDKKDGNKVKDILIEEKRNLKCELLTLKRETANYRMHIATLKRDTSRLKREIDEQNVPITQNDDGKSISPCDSFQDLKPKSAPKLPVYRIHPRRRRTCPSKQYQRSLNKSIAKMKTVFNNFNEEGWEEVSESLELEDETDLTGSDTLGEAIVQACRLNTNRSSNPSFRQPQNSRKAMASRTRAVHNPSPTNRRIAGSLPNQRPGQSSSSPESVMESARGAQTPTNRRIAGSLPNQRQGQSSSSPESVIESSKSRTDRRIAGSLPYQRQERGSTSPESMIGSSSVENVHRIIYLREMATSPINVQTSSSSDTNNKQRTGYSRLTTPLSRQIGPLKQRVNYLQQQVNTLRESRANALKTVNEQKDQILHLQSELNQSNQRLKMTKINVQKLTSDLERVQKDKTELENQLTLRDESSTGSVLASSLTDKHHTEQDWKSLEHKIKTSSAEVLRQAATIKTLKLENEQLQDQIKKVTEKLNHSERDNNQKRTLVESQRNKIKIMGEKAKLDSEMIVELETKVKILSESSDKTKIQIDSLKKRITAVSKDKKDVDETNMNLVSDIDKLNKQLFENTKRYSNLESAMIELEQTAKDQLRSVASQSDQTIDSFQLQLISAKEKVMKFEQFVKMLSCELLSRVDDTRREIRNMLTASERAKEPHDPTLAQAKIIARDLFNLSQSDIEDIMSESNNSQSEEEILRQKKEDKKWIKKCEKTLHCQDFVQPLVEMMVDKIEERSELIRQTVSIET